MEIWDSIKFEVEERIPTNDLMFWRTDFPFLASIPAWPFFLSLAITTDFPLWQCMLAVITAVVVVLWARVILRLRRQKKANRVPPSKFSEDDAGGGF